MRQIFLLRGYIHPNEQPVVFIPPENVSATRSYSITVVQQIFVIESKCVTFVILREATLVKMSQLPL